MSENDGDMQREIGEFRRNPLGFVRYAFPWGQAGTALAHEAGPEPWQCEVLEQLGQGLMSPEEATRLAVASGHGIGKSALVAWIILWAMSTVEDTRGVVTAHTDGQLRTNAWPEPTKRPPLDIKRRWVS